MIDIATLTNSTHADKGTGVFDVLSESVIRHIEKQFKENRLSGADYANVFLGSMQSVMAESNKFILTEQQASEQANLLIQQVISEVKNNETGGVIDLQKQNIQEEIDLTIAKTANQYEQVSASQGDTVRKNLLNSKEVTYREKQTGLVIRQESELALNGAEERLLTIEKRIATTSGALDNTNKTNAGVSLTNAQETKVDAEKILVDSQNVEVPLNGISQRLVNTSQIAKIDAEKILVDSQNTEVAPNATSQRSVNTAQVTKLGAETTLLASRNAETLAGTTRTDAESAQRVLLMTAQTTGFKTDAKQKLLKQLFEGYAVNVTTIGEVTASPTGSAAASLDAVANDILDDLSSTVNI